MSMPQWPAWEDRRNEIEAAIREHAAECEPLPGVVDPARLEVLSKQIVASLRRERYHERLRAIDIDGRRSDPRSDFFDPERAAVLHLRRGDVDEAAWLVFLMTLFAKPLPPHGWRRLQDVYGLLDERTLDWQTITEEPDLFPNWLNGHWHLIGGRFGNHRKYESVRPTAKRHIGHSIADYVVWVTSFGDHRGLFAAAVEAGGNDQGRNFEWLMRGMRSNICGFDRLGAFDFVAMLGRYGIAPVRAGSAYFPGATGPATGARLLFDGPGERSKAAVLQSKLDGLDARVGVGMEVWEDALCNWQKSPAAFVHYKG